MINYLGFFLPISLVLGPRDADRKPGLGVCSKCLRGHTRCYRYGARDAEAICAACLSDIVRVAGRRASAHARSTGPVKPSIRAADAPEDEFVNRVAFWQKAIG